MSIDRIIHWAIDNSLHSIGPPDPLGSAGGGIFINIPIQYMRDRSPSQQLIQQLAAGKLFRMVSIMQIGIHLSAYIATFIALIIIKAGGYYDTEIIRFVVITLISMPLFAIGLWLFKHSLKLSQRQRWWGYCFHLFVSIWSIAIVKIGYGLSI